MIAFSISGYSRTFRSTAARRPSNSRNRLTTLASTGLRMKISVKAMSAVFRRGLFVLVRRNRVVYADRDTGPQLEQATAGNRLAGLETFRDGHHIPAAVTQRDKALRHHLCTVLL